MTKPIDNLLKSHFKKLVVVGKELALSTYKKNITDKVNTLSQFEIVKLLMAESKIIDKKIEDHPHPYYIQNSDEWLLSLFANRTFLLNVDDSTELTEAVFLTDYRSLLSKHKKQIRESLPKLTYRQFLKGKECDYFRHFTRFYNIDEPDYYKIKEWQADVLYKIVKHDTAVAINLIQKYCSTLKDPLSFIKLENDLMDTGFEMKEYKQFRNNFDKLYLANIWDVKEMSEDKLFEAFEPFIDEMFHWGMISPVSLKIPLIRLPMGSNEFIGNEYTFYYTLNQIKSWYEEIVEGRSIQEPIVGNDFTFIVNKSIEDAQEKADIVIDQLVEFCYDEMQSKENVEKYLIDLLEEYRIKFNTLDSKHYLHFFRDKMEMLEKVFITNSFFGQNIDKQQLALTEAKFVYEVVWAIVQAYTDIFNTHKIGDSDMSSSEIYFLLHKMVLDKDMYQEFDSTSNEFFDDLHSLNMPYELLVRNHREKMSSIFQRCISNMEDVLNDAEPNSKILYIHSRLKELKQRQLTLKNYEKEWKYHKRDFKYSNLFKDFLQIETEFIDATKELSDFKFLKNSKVKLLDVAVTEVNTNVISNDKMLFIKKMLEDLSITVNGISAISERKKGVIRGIVIALRNANILPNQSVDILSQQLASDIGLQLNSKLDSSNISDQYEKKAKQYIDANYNT